MPAVAAGSARRGTAGVAGSRVSSAWYGGRPGSDSAMRRWQIFMQRRRQIFAYRLLADLHAADRAAVSARTVQVWHYGLVILHYRKDIAVV